MTRLFLVAKIANERVAIPAADVEAVVKLESISAVPRAAPHVAGLAALRSRVLTVIDCRLSLEIGCFQRQGPTEAIIVTHEGHSYALLVDRVEDVLNVAGEVEPIRIPLSPGWRRAAMGVLEVEGDVLLLVDPHALVAGPAREPAEAA